MKKMKIKHSDDLVIDLNIDDSQQAVLKKSDIYLSMELCVKTLSTKITAKLC